MVEHLTFALAMLGYLGLTIAAAMSGRTFRFSLWRCTVPIIVLHVVLVWSVRYQWQWARATRNGYAGFLIFHTALLMIVISAFLNSRAAAKIVPIAYLVVTAGALGAVFRYDIVAVYRIPVILCALSGAGVMLRHAVSR